jgi:hypothetical protein
MTEEFKAGDRVLYNGSLVADIEYIDYQNDRIRLTAKSGRSTETIQGTGDEAHTGPATVTLAEAAEEFGVDLTDDENENA